MLKSAGKSLSLLRSTAGLTLKTSLWLLLSNFLLSTQATAQIGPNPSVSSLEDIYVFPAAIPLSRGLTAINIPDAPRPNDLTSSEQRLIQPGAALLPEFGDKPREKLILKIIDDIYNGRPLQFPQDGTTFGNRENLLPKHDNGYYKEYTLLPKRENPNAPDYITIGGKRYTVPPSYGTRGPERLVTGAGDELYYTLDHYRSFIQLTVLP